MAKVNFKNVEELAEYLNEYELVNNEELTLDFFEDVKVDGMVKQIVDENDSISDWNVVVVFKEGSIVKYIENPDNDFIDFIAHTANRTEIAKSLAVYSKDVAEGCNLTFIDWLESNGADKVCMDYEALIFNK